MPLFDHGSLIGFELVPAISVLAARANHFSEAGGVVIATGAFIALFALTGIVIAMFAFVLLCRASDLRGAYIWLLPAACTFALFNIIDIPTLVAKYNDPPLSAKAYASLNCASLIFYWWTDALLLATTLFVLRNRRNAVAVAANQSADIMRVVSLVLDLLLLVVFVILAFARSVSLANAIRDRSDGKIRKSEYADRVESILTMGYLLIVIMFLLVLDVGVSAMITRGQVSGPDLPTTTVLITILPMLIVHWVYRTAMTIEASLEWYGRIEPSEAATNALDLAFALEAGLFMGGIMIALLVVGFKRDAWNDHVKHHPVYTGLAAVPDTYFQQPWAPQQSVYQTRQVAQYSQQPQRQANLSVAHAQAPSWAPQHAIPNVPQV